MSFFKRIWRKPPLVFPWIAGLHLFMLGFSCWLYRDFPFPSEYWIAPAWLAVYTFAWLFLCDLKKWAAFLYLGLIIVHTVLNYFLTSALDRALYTPPFLLAYVLFGFFILVYYKKFQ